jgi:cytochrome c-type biogenesis protein CcmE
LTRRGRRLSLIAVALVVIGFAVSLGLYAFSGSIALFLSPSELAAKNVELGSRLRIGGLVAPGSVVRGSDRLDFIITDGTKTVNVDCAGDCFANIPDLFREGQGVVAEGVLAAPVRLQCDRILAKHDERYMPREVVEALKKQGRWQEGEGVAKP